MEIDCHNLTRNKKCKEVATEEFLKGRLVLLLEIERPLSISHVFSKQSVFYFIKLSALFFSPLMLYFIFNPLGPFLFCLCLLGKFLYVMSSFFWLYLAAAWWAVLHLLYYSYFDGHNPLCPLHDPRISYICLSILSISQGYPCLNPAGAVFLLFFPRIFLETLARAL